jgi:hypothetical protein
LDSDQEVKKLTGSAVELVAAENTDHPLIRRSKMVPAISQYRLVGALQACTSVPLNPSSQAINQNAGKRKNSNSHHKKESDDSSFARFLETAVLGYRAQVLPSSK